MSLSLLFFSARGLPTPSVEYQFAPPRRWRFDYAFVPQKLAVEVEGGAWIAGRHTRGAGFIADMEKYNEACARGWRLLRVQPKDLLSEATVELIRRALKR